jgi:hypothetical protein
VCSSPKLPLPRERDPTQARHGNDGLCRCLLGAFGSIGHLVQLRELPCQQDTHAALALLQLQSATWALWSFPCWTVRSCAERKQSQATPAFLRSPPMSPICSVALLRSTTNPGGFSLPSKRATLGHAAPQQRRPANPRRDAPVRPLAVGALPQRQVYAPGPDGDNTLDHPLGWQCLE